jgi:hypothetical protein
MSDNLFEKLANLTIYERTLKIARPEDIIKEDENPDGTVKFHVREGATYVTELKIRALTDTEREKAEREVACIAAPPSYKEEFHDDGKTLKSRTKVGHDEDDPDYLEKRRHGTNTQQAMVALMGCPKLAKDTEGKDLEEKIENLRSHLDSKIISFIAQSIWSLGYSGSDAADFFLNNGSDSTPSSDTTGSDR